MGEEAYKSFAEQLRQPKGEFAVQFGEEMNKSNFRINIDTIESLKLTGSDSLLEIGMGNGFFVKHLFNLNKSIKYIGCDSSEKMVDEARKLNQQLVKTRQADFYIASAEDLPFKGEIFNKVFSVHSIYFWNNPELALSEIYRVLKPSGQLTISIRPKLIMEHYPYVKFGFIMYNQTDLTNLLSNNNFNVIETLENEEYEKELNGKKIIIKSLIITAKKR